ncbi:hypothetical protein NX059_005669 [Plenodomus lindquistii]|nr:hypothetical protein NX059_005669 [Plenodomus lindquistii]
MTSICDQIITSLSSLPCLASSNHASQYRIHASHSPRSCPSPFTFLTDMSDTACLEAPVAAHDLDTHRSLPNTAVYAALALVTAPYRRAFQLYTWQPLQEIAAAGADPDLLIPLVREWKADKYAELQSVQVAATFCGGAVFSSLPLSRTAHAVWAADASWMAALICAISAIITGIQTKSVLDDLPSGQQLESPLSLPDIELQRMRRTILQYKKTPGAKHLIMMFIWQFPSMTMAYAWCCYLGGLTIYVCTPFLQSLPWQDRHKVCASLVRLHICSGCIRQPLPI